MTAQEWLRKASASLESAGIADAESDAWLMFSHVTGMSRMEYTLDRDKCLSDEEICSLAKMLEKRNQHIPVQQITGEAWFMGYPFFVNENVLIPRMDTEVLVEAVLTRLPAVPVHPSESFEGRKRPFGHRGGYFRKSASGGPGECAQTGM